MSRGAVFDGVAADAAKAGERIADSYQRSP
jgi:hypothetical protein